jgi:leucyl aminopeptidase
MCRENELWARLCAMSDASAAVSAVDVATARSAPRTATAVGWAVATKGAVPRQLGLSRSALEATGFEAKAGQTLVVPHADGVAVAIGVGDPGTIDSAGLRSAPRPRPACRSR